MIGYQYADSLNATPAASNVFVFECVSNRWSVEEVLPICCCYIFFRCPANLDLQVMAKAGLDSQTQEV